MNKILMGILIFIGVIVLMIVILIATMAILVSKNNNENKTYSKVLSGPSADAPKALVVYQPSMSGRPEKIAAKIAEGLNDGGFEVTLVYPNSKLSADLSRYSVVVMGSTVFAGQPSKALLDYALRVGDFSGKTVLLFSNGGMETMPELDLFDPALKGALSVEKQKFLANDGSFGEKAYELGKKLAE